MNKIILGDCLEKLKELPDESVDCIVTDPPYGYSFMGKDWDKAVPSVEIWQECLRVLKHGGFAFVMSAPRQDVLSQMIVRLGQAGFKTDFTSLYWTYASGFPKASNIGKMVDKRMGVEREVLGTYDPRSSIDGSTRTEREIGGQQVTKSTSQVSITKATSEEAKALDGSYGGFQPKPAVEVIIVCMKPLSEKTYVDQALKNGKGITWLDDARIPGRKEWGSGHINFAQKHAERDKEAEQLSFNREEKTNEGRFPANLIVSNNVLNENSKYFDLDKWAETLPFLMTPKASKSEKNKGLEEFEIQPPNYSTSYRPTANESGDKGADTPYAGTNRNGTMKNAHPTVKPLKLMSYLITLGSRPNDTILDPFCGSGTTCLSAKQLGRNYIGIELQEEYVKIAEARLDDKQQSMF